MIKAAVIGASGYIGGELVRLLAMHPEVEISAVTSRRYNGKKIHKVHPNLRKLNLRFTNNYNFDADVIFLAVPHGTSMKIIDDYIGSAKIIDLSADFRVTLNLYEEYYGEHLKPELISDFVYGLPEIHREEIKKAELIANPGCNATAVILALYPFKGEIGEAIVDLKVSSSAGGRRENVASIHPERSNVVRVYKPSHHRHEAEVKQETKVNAQFTVHSVDLIRGLLATIYFKMETNEKELYKRYFRYLKEPFVRIVKEKEGLQKLPDPKYVIGSNFVDIGFTYDEKSQRVILFSALDNLIKGGAGQAVQNMNIVFGLEETLGLNYLPVYPI
ncbi:MULTISPECIES: N-acetyl-gamma-glutamyl-phosphate reductase [Thermococcus]|uniref:N-acetyl-gamma-glutamyl-phosphate reductase n=1 Tax=Thermococcus sibiricus TaxID=172049 RepID=A0A101EMZ1_9EURY|nr:MULTISPECIES: N-acetyl-gamma-glutamyl-phosphate reductase [Thermococcus]KUK17925.1 MAG: N-acetyl-gamma-glutamyl-phosphate/N-acetyl-gamma-aminoadipyl-phosphate reductase [Thermococcus sibiricus]KUK29334.1 MAG: N-acetyl-gamma-glutamyl-phosphate/N-acetyl-gamma-aminoadipyl-phosphate reductase [Thermococcus sp. 40_45]MBC7094638.1 N-acetyl-gamma-glutamyl-phosphate reductase [Thermococcus sp.]HII67884.1 N-acetyl-gamma-glutamyl-phosphate reductase [Thermococcaceae archaeon]